MISVRNRNKGTDKPAVWEYRFEVAKIGGKRKQFSKSGFRTKKEAEAAGLKALNEYNSCGTIIANSEMSYSDFLDLYLEQYCKANLKQTSYNRTKTVVENYLRPEFGNYKISSLTPLRLQEYINDLFNRDLSLSTKGKVKAILVQSLKYAVIPYGLLKSSPAQYLTTPKNTTGGKSVERYVFTYEQIKQLVDYYGLYSPYSAAILISYFSGLRAGEVFALFWEDIDFDNKQIVVNKSMSEFGITTPKTKSSNRIVKIGENLTSYLLKYRAEQLKNKMFYGEFWQECNEDYVLRRENGEYANYYALKQSFFIQIPKHLGFPVNFHSFRHTHATRLIEAGISPKVVQERLGHSDISITMNKYVHSTEQMQQTAVEVFDKIAK